MSEADEQSEGSCSISSVGGNVAVAFSHPASSLTFAPQEAADFAAELLKQAVHAAGEMGISVDFHMHGLWLSARSLGQTQ